jgi:hypothetical protein
MNKLIPLLLSLFLPLRPLKKDTKAMVDLGVVLLIGISFAALMVIAYIIYTIRDQLITDTTSADVNATLTNITTGFDNAVNLLLIAITIFILAIAIAALLMLRGR